MVDSPTYIFYRATQPSRSVTPPQGYQCELWTPSLLNPLPKGLTMGRGRFLFRTLMHVSRQFSNRDCGMLLLRRGDGAIAHYSAFAGGWFRWPFMAREDVQIGDTWTEDQDRRKGLALFALVTIIEKLRKPERTFWYFCTEDNVGSRRVAEQAGMEIAGSGGAYPVMGLNLLRQYRITSSEVPRSVAPTAS